MLKSILTEIQINNSAIYVYLGLNKEVNGCQMVRIRSLVFGGGYMDKQGDKARINHVLVN